MSGIETSTRSGWCATASLALLACGGGDRAPTSRAAPAAQEITAAQRLVRAQVDAYNRHDLDAFANTYAADATFYAFPDTLVGRGQEMLRAQYGQVFANSPNLHVSVIGELVAGKYVILEELLTGSQGPDSSKHVVIYEVTNGKISRVWFLPPTGPPTK